MLLEASLVFVQGDISRIVQAVFNAPVGAQHFQELGWRSLFSRQAGDAIDRFFPCFSGFREGNGSLELEDLLEERPVKEIIELAAGGQGPYFETPMSFARDGGRLEILGWAAHAG